MAENNILVSVIVPVYNVENYIEKCLESIVNQTYKNLQIILVVVQENQELFVQKVYIQ